MLLGIGGRHRTTTSFGLSSSKRQPEHALQLRMLPYGYGDHVARRIDRTSLLPVLIAPKILHRSEPRCDDMVRYTEWAPEGLAHHFARRER
jgi:hypothetical protein